MINMILLQAQGKGGSMWIWMIAILVIMWLLMMRPQRKREMPLRRGREFFLADLSHILRHLFFDPGQFLRRHLGVDSYSV